MHDKISEYLSSDMNKVMLNNSLLSTKKIKIEHYN